MEIKHRKRYLTQHQEQGAMFVEYVVTVCFVMTMIYALFVDQFYSPSNGFQGMLGEALAGIMQRILEGIAMPIP